MEDIEDIDMIGKSGKISEPIPGRYEKGEVKTSCTIRRKL
jgi:hypothetical protein